MKRVIDIGIALCVLGLSAGVSRASQDRRHGAVTEQDGDAVVSVRDRDGKRYEQALGATADVSPDIALAPASLLETPRAPAKAPPRSETQESLTLSRIRNSHVNLSEVFHLPAERANAILDQIARGDGEVMSEQIRKLKSPELHALYDRLQGMEARGELRYRDQQSLLGYLKTMKDESGKFDPEGVSRRNTLNLSQALNLPGGNEANQILTRIAHGDESTIAQHLQALSADKRKALLDELQGMESAGKFMYEDQKALLKYMKSQSPGSTSPGQ